MLNVDEDCVQMWKLHPAQPWLGDVRGHSPLIAVEVAVLDGGPCRPVLESDS
jgi:hypothetical protein